MTERTELDAPTAETVERLDYSKPPPGCEIVNKGERWHGVIDGLLVFVMASQSDVLAAAWTDHKARRDPPGLRVDSEEADWYVQVLDLPHYDAPGHIGPARFFTSEDEARAVARAWYDWRLALYEQLSMITFSGLRTPLWPRMLAWSDDQVDEVDRWLVDSTAEMPEVLRG